MKNKIKLILLTTSLILISFNSFSQHHVRVNVKSPIDSCAYLSFVVTPEELTNEELASYIMKINVDSLPRDIETISTYLITIVKNYEEKKCPYDWAYFALICVILLMIALIKSI
jgi:hypothetical protein